jgi:hypothetical protein
MSPDEREAIRQTALKQLRVIGASAGVTEAWIDQTLWIKALSKTDKAFLRVNHINPE